MSYDKLTGSDQHLYNQMIAICDACKDMNSCKQHFKWQRPIITEDKIFKTYRLNTTDCDKKRGYIMPTPFLNKVRNVPSKYWPNPSRNRIVQKIKALKKGFLYGGAGGGKSTIMQFIANFYWKNGYNIGFNSGANIVKDLKDFDNKDTKTILDQYQNIEMLFIDDMFRENITSYTIMDIYNQILQYRIDNDKPTFISSNYSIAEIEEIITSKVDKQSAEALVSRLKSLQIHRLEDRDYRTTAIPDL